MFRDDSRAMKEILKPDVHNFAQRKQRARAQKREDDAEQRRQMDGRSIEYGEGGAESDFFNEGARHSSPGENWRRQERSKQKESLFAAHSAETGATCSHRDVPVTRDSLDVYKDDSKCSSINELKQQTIRLNFRSDNAFMSLAEMEAKKKISRELQASLMQQILEKKKKQEHERRRQAEDEERDATRVQRELEAIRREYARQVTEERQKERRNSIRHDSVAEAWLLAKTDSQNARSQAHQKQTGESTIARKEGDTSEKDSLDTHVAQWTTELQRIREEYEKHRMVAKKEFETQLAHIQQMYVSELEGVRMKTQTLETRHSTSLVEMERLRRQIRTLTRRKKTNSGEEIQIHLPTQRTIERVQSARNRTRTSSLRLSAWEIGHVDYPTLLDHARHVKASENDCGEISGQTAFLYPNGKLVGSNSLEKQTGDKDSLERLVEERRS